MDPEELANLTPEAFEALSDDERMALLSGQMPAADQPTETVTTEPAATSTTTEPDPTQGVSAPQPQPTVEQQPMEQVNRGDLTVALRQEREARRQIEAKLAQVTQVLQDPQQLAQMLGLQQQQPQAPELAFEDPDVISQLVAQQVAPLQQTVQTLQQQLAQAEQEKVLMGLRSQYPDLDDALSEFDSNLPQMANMHPLAKYFMVHGSRTTDPKYLQQQIEAKANELAEQRVAERLKGLTSTAQPVTLSGVTPAGGASDGIDLANITDEQWDSLDEKTRARLLRGG